MGEFLRAYAGMRGLRMQEGEAADRRRQARRADQLAQVQMNEAGYDEVQMPEIQAPPGQSFAQKVGRFLSGPEQPSSIVVKTRPSTRETEIAGAQQFETGRDQSRFDNERAVTELQGAIQARIDANRQAHEDARKRDDNVTHITVAGMERGVQQQRLNASERDSFFDRAIEAAGGDAVQAMANAERFQKGKALALGATRTEYHAAAARYKDRKAALTREGYASREEIAAQRNPFGDAFAADLRSRVEGTRPALPPAPKGSSVTPATLSDADEWEKLKNQGLSNDEATRRVLARKSGPSPLSARDKAAAQQDAGFAAHLTQLGYRKGVDF